MLFDFIITFFVIWLIILNRKRKQEIIGLELKIRYLEKMKEGKK